jgi:hypothetical protein
VSGYVRIHRSLRGHPAFRNDAEAMAFAWMVMGAAWQLTRVRYKERLIVLQRGQIAVSQRDMARALDRDKAWIERLWKRLKSEAMIAASCEAGVAVITICNYNEFQAESNSREAVDEAPREARARQGQGTEQVREESEEEESEAIASVSHRFPISEAVEFYNTNARAVGWPTVAKLNDGRKRDLRNRLREHGLDGWKAAIIRARASSFLAGPDPPSWFNFDFLVHPRKFSRVIEGNYDRRNSDSADPTLVALREYQQLVGDVGSGFGSG